MISPTQKGAAAELAIAAAAVDLGIRVLWPLCEGGRYDLAIELGSRLVRVQCKRAALHGDVIKVALRTSRHTPRGYVTTTYGPDEIDAVGVYCPDLRKCYLLPISLVAGRQAIHLRLAAPKNGQLAGLHFAAEYELGAVAQLEERRAGSAKARGSSPLSSTPSSREPGIVKTGAHDFRNRFGYYMERAAAGDEIHVSRRGKPYVRLMPAALPAGADGTVPGAPNARLFAA